MLTQDPRSPAPGAAESTTARSLAQDVVIDAPAIDARTGAHAVVPDRSPLPERDAPLDADVPVGAAVSATLQREVEQFIQRQAELLDAKQWQAWIDLFAQDGIYWMPATPTQSSWLDAPSIFAEDRAMMEVRQGRVMHPNAWSQAPTWATHHLVGHVVVESVDADALLVRSRFQMMELRRDQIRHFAGTYRHTLRRDLDGTLRIRLQRVDLFNGQAPFDYVLQIWV